MERKGSPLSTHTGEGRQLLKWLLNSLAGEYPSNAVCPLQDHSCSADMQNRLAAETLVL